MRIFSGLLFILSIICATAAGAQDFVVTKGKLSDQSFYRLIACAAPPGGQCQRKLLKWKKRELTVAFVTIDDGLSARWKAASNTALQNAIREINGVGAGIRLVAATGSKADIRVHLVARERIEQRAGVRNMDELLRSSAVGMARVHTSGSVIKRADVFITTGNRERDLPSVMLEEVIQSLGLLTDIHNRRYHNKSIFSETGSRTKRLKGQDAKVLRMHYPK